MKKNKPKKSGVAKVPVVIQLEYRECGAACLSMIMSYYGKIIPLSKVRYDCGISRNGTSAGNIARAARSYGFIAKGYSLNTELIKETVSFPCIIHWDMKHFVVLCGFRKDKAIICSPASGYQKIDREEFDSRFTGVVIDIVPGKDFKPEGKQTGVLSFAKERLKGMVPAMMILSLIMILNSVLALIKPFFDRYFLDDILGTGNGNLNLFISVMASLSAVEIIISLFQILYRLKLNRKLSREGSRTYMDSLFNKPVDFFTQRMAGDLMLRQKTNANISLTLLNTFSPLVLQSVMMVFFLVFMIRESLVLSLIGMITVFINLFLIQLTTEKRLEYSRLLLNDAKIYENYRKIIWNMNDIEFEHFFNGKRNYPFNVPNKHTFLMLMNKIENYRFVLDWGYNERLYPYLDQLWNNYVCMENLKSHKEEDIKNFLESGNINYSSWPESIKNEFKKSIQHTINTIVSKCKKEYEQLKGLPRMLIDQINGFIKYLSNNIKFEKMKNVVEKLHLKLIKDFLFKSESSIGKYVYYSIAKDVITPVVEFLTPNSLSCIFDYVKNFMNSNITLYYFETYVTLTDIKSALDDYHKIKHIADKTEDYRYELNKIVKDFEEHIKNIYRVLMSRGKKGCYIYCMDQKLGDYFRFLITQC